MYDIMVKAKLNHVALPCKDRLKAETFFTKVLEIPKLKTYILSMELTESIFGIKSSLEVDVYDNGTCKFEVFEATPDLKYGFGHTCIEVDNKDYLITLCKQYGIETMDLYKGEKKLLFIKDFCDNMFEIK